jgi:hypothetical protein
MTLAPETNAKVMSALWGGLIGACLPIIVGFAWGGWTTTRAAEKVSAEAVLVDRAAICVAQFMNDPDRAAAIGDFHRMYRSRRSYLIEIGGWDRMPGQTKAGWGVSGACVRGIEARIGNGAPPAGSRVSR